MVEVLVACVVLAGMVWFVRRRADWTRSWKAGVIGFWTIAVAFLAFAGFLGCLAPVFQHTPENFEHCSDSTAATWGVFGLIAAGMGLAQLIRGLALAWIDRTPRTWG